MKLMKLISAAVITAAISAVCAVSAAAQDISLDRISSSAAIVQTDNYRYAKMTKNRTLTNTLVVEENEALVIPNGCKLILKNGAEINGTLFIEEGGYLAVKGGTLILNGCAVSDGTISIGIKAGISVRRNSELFVSKSGTLKISSSDMIKVSFDGYADVVCEGKFTAPKLNKGYAKSLCAVPMSAIKMMYEPSGIRTALDFYSYDEAAYILPKARNYETLLLPVGGYEEQVTVLYDNGCCVKFSVLGERLLSIGNADIHSILSAFGPAVTSDAWEFLKDDPAPVYDYAAPSENIGDGAPLSYEELQEYLDTDNMNLLRFEILDVYSPKEAVALTKDFVFQDRGGATLFKARLTYDYLNDKPLDIEVNISHPGTDKMQYDNFPLYGVGEEYIASFVSLDLNKTRIVPNHELEFAVRSNGREERAFHLRFDYVNFITPDGKDLDMGIPGGRALVVTTTKNNPIKYVHMYDIDELAEFFRNDWTARGYKFSKL